MPAKHAKGREKKVYPRMVANEDPYLRLLAAVRGQNLPAFFSRSFASFADRLLIRRKDSSPAFPEANAAKAFALAKSFHDHFVAVFEESSLLTRR